MRMLLVLAFSAWAQAGFGFQSQPVSQKVSIEPRIPLTLPPAGEPEFAAHLRIDASMVLIPANVSTNTGARIVDLTKDDFRVFQDNVEQRISYFAKEDAPLSVGLLFDSSGSMRNRIRQAAAAAAQFFRTSNPEDEFFLVEFNDKPKLVVPFAADPNRLQAKISRMRPFGRTALIDAVQMGLVQLKKARHSRKALVILSDGDDNRSRVTVKQLRSTVIESGVQVYAMGIFDDPPLVPLKGTLPSLNGARLLDELAIESGGRHFRVDDPDDLPAIGARIGEELRTQYLLGYVPDRLEKDGKYHRVTLQLVTARTAPALQLHYRRGYYAPRQ